MSVETFHDGRVTLHAGDCLAVLATLPENSVDAVVTDPPYHLTSIVKRFGGAAAKGARDYTGERAGATGASRGFMGKEWDGGDVAFRPETWAAVLRVLKPGGHLVAFAACKSSHRMICAIEDAGFEVRDALMWLFGSGFPKSLDVSKAIDKALGAQRDMVVIPAREVRNPKAHGSGRDGLEGASRPWIEKALERGFHEKQGKTPASDAGLQWRGWGTALKPAYEPICLARKPLSESSVAANVLRWRTGALNIDATRVGESGARNNGRKTDSHIYGKLGPFDRVDYCKGRWPANVAHDGSDEVVGEFPITGKSTGGRIGNAGGGSVANVPTGRFEKGDPGYGDEGSAARFFYSAKANASDRVGSKHPTVKPVSLMRWLVRLVTPPGGLVLDPFAGSGTTGEAALRERAQAVLIEREADYCADIARRMGAAFDGAALRAVKRAQARDPAPDQGPLFGGGAAEGGGGGGPFTDDTRGTHNRPGRA